MGRVANQVVARFNNPRSDLTSPNAILVRRTCSSCSWTMLYPHLSTLFPFLLRLVFFLSVLDCSTIHRICCTPCLWDSFLLLFSFILNVLVPTIQTVNIGERLVSLSSLTMASDFENCRICGCAPFRNLLEENNLYTKRTTPKRQLYASVYNAIALR